MDTLGLRDDIDLRLVFDVMEEEILKMDPTFFDNDTPMEPLNLPEGFAGPPAPMAEPSIMQPPVEEVPTIEQEPQVQPVPPSPQPPAPQRPAPAPPRDPMRGLQSGPVRKDTRADALFEE